jgi:hypothetical protein
MLSPSLDPIARKEMILYGVDLNKLSPKEDCLAIVPIEEPLSLIVIPPKQVAPMAPHLRHKIIYF